MGSITDKLNEEELQDLYDGIRANIEKAIYNMSTSAQSAQKVLTQFADALNTCAHVDTISQPSEISCNQTQGQHPLALDETQLESTGKSVDIDEVLAKIDKALETDSDPKPSAPES